VCCGYEGGCAALCTQLCDPIAAEVFECDAYSRVNELVESSTLNVYCFGSASCESNSTRRRRRMRLPLFLRVYSVGAQ